MQDASDLLTAVLREWMEVVTRRLMHNYILYAKENHLSMSQMGALMRIQRQGACSVSEIGSDLGITSAAASQMLDRLVQQGLIERTEDPNDRRAKKIVLTDKGRRMLREGLRMRQTWFDDLARTLSPDEQAQAIDVLDLLLERTKQLSNSEAENAS